MLVLFGILIIIASVVLGVIVLIQNPKGGGLNSSISGVGNQLMGVKQTNDILEKGTWIFAGIIGLLCITSSLFISNSGSGNSKDKFFNEAPVGTPVAPQTAPVQMPSSQAPAANTPAPQTTVPAPQP
ncbi:MAG: preprotein translocase subunit SecG [Ginsengibacter sp.]